MRNDWWLNRDACLFDVSKEPIYLKYVEVLQINWSSPTTIGPVTANVILSGYLPKALCLDSLGSESRLEITITNIGPREEYRSENVKLRFYDCKIIERQIEKPVSLDSGEYKNISIRIILTCLLEILP